MIGYPSMGLGGGIHPTGGPQMPGMQAGLNMLRTQVGLGGGITPTGPQMPGMQPGPGMPPGPGLGGGVTPTGPQMPGMQPSLGMLSGGPNNGMGMYRRLIGDMRR